MLVEAEICSLIFTRSWRTWAPGAKYHGPGIYEFTTHLNTVRDYAAPRFFFLGSDVWVYIWSDILATENNV